ncbi:transglycosylase domain-containing protein [Aquibacillus salsiterrae]|uniref:Penicillin-binding protein n=1 Tax=Aquibacillus salsiterrae TaxID=2950439 RepID=A0A9X3WD52_9BACI|nr:transglycosylase domain-containing protein [Aquibacillus salsiterrae]MDC3416803.1 penicillin-binding protein [Aquibacillus salsiterrae]
MFTKTKAILGKIENKYVRWSIAVICSSGLLAAILVLGLYLYTFSLGPPSLASSQNTIYYSANGQVIGEENSVENRYWVPLDDISDTLIEATLLTEDRNFYEHDGFDIKRIFGAAIKDIRSMSMVQGASTITQQYARNLYLSYEKTWKRKLKEAFYALRLEMFYSKDKILEGYLNTIYYGHGAYGIEAASRYYFDKSADELTLAEASMLTGIPKGPTYYSPLRNFDNAKERQQQILTSLYKLDVISKEQAEAALQTKLAFAGDKERTVKTVAPYFQDVVVKELAIVLNKTIEEIRSGGYQVYTTLDINKQKDLEGSIKANFPKDTELQVGAVAMEPKTGAIVSMVGGRNYEESQFNRSTQAARMPGSSFKPFLYYAALENGFTATTTLMSKPTNFELANGTVYQPSNYNGYYADKPITLAQALALSDNIYAVKTNLFVSPETLVKTARKFGIKSKLDPYASLALGTASVTVREMVTGYSTLANGGRKVEPYTIEKVTDAKGNVLYKRKQKKEKQVLDPKKAFILANLMTGMFDESLNGYMRVTGATIADQLSKNYAGKSGTTKTDSWMVGFSPSLVTGVWTGYDQNIPITKVKEQGIAKQVWASYMEKAHEDIPFKAFKVPDGVVGRYIDPASGKLATPYCKNQRLMYFEKGTEPTEYCNLHTKETSDEKVDQPTNNEPTKVKDSFFNRILNWFR